MRTSLVSGTIRKKMVVCGMAAVALSAAGITYAVTAGHAQFAGQNLKPVKLTAATRTLSKDTVGSLPSLIVTETASLPNDSAGDLTATCPRGYTLTGGGASVGPLASNGLPEGGANAYISASYAEHNGSRSTGAWFGIGNNLSGSTVTLIVQAVCVSSEPVPFLGSLRTIGAMCHRPYEAGAMAHCHVWACGWHYRRDLDPHGRGSPRIHRSDP